MVKTWSTHRRSVVVAASPKRVVVVRAALTGWPPWRSAISESHSSQGALIALQRTESRWALHDESRGLGGCVVPISGRLATSARRLLLPRPTHPAGRWRSHGGGRCCTPDAVGVSRLHEEHQSIRSARH